MIEAESMTSREELHRIIDSLAEDQIVEVRQYVEELRELGTSHEESLSDETLAAVREGARAACEIPSKAVCPSG
jgi:hypothetical protein